MTTEELEEKASTTTDVDELRDIVAELAARCSEAEEELESARVDPERNQVLASSIRAFAEWQTAGYEGGDHTRNVISRALWSEVSLHARAICRLPETAGHQPTWMDTPAEGEAAGRPDPGYCQQSLFALA